MRAVDRRDARREDIGPTQETLAKLESDAVREMFLSGRTPIRQHHWDAALEIRGIYAAIGRGMFPAFRPQEGGHIGYRQRDFLDLMSPAERRAWGDHYVPWTRRVGRAARYAWALVIDNDATAAGNIDAAVSGLRIYAEIAGFCGRSCK